MDEESPERPVDTLERRLRRFPSTAVSCLAVGVENVRLGTVLLVDAREERLARNEAAFRSANEGIERAAASSGIRDRHVFEFLCECSNADCNLMLPLTLTEYEAIRANPTLFIVADGHELPEIETVILRRGPYQVVAKRGEAADYVAEHDPRGST